MNERSSISNDEGSDEPAQPFFDVPGLDTHVGQQALAVAFRALRKYHANGMRIPGSTHESCRTRDHGASACPCCPACAPLATAMLHSRKRRGAFAQLSWPAFYLELAQRAELSYEEYRERFGAAPQRAQQWVLDGLERLAPRYGLPADARVAIVASTALRRVLDDAWEPDRVSLALTVLGEIAVHGRRKELDGDAEGVVSMDKVAMALVTHRDTAPARVEIALTGSDVRQLIVDVVSAIADAPAMLTTQAASAGRLLDERVLRYIIGDDSLDRINEVSFGGREFVSAFSGQDPYSRVTTDLGELQRRVQVLSLTKLRKERFSDHVSDKSAADREQAIETRARNQLKSCLCDLAKALGHPAEMIGEISAAAFRLMSEQVLRPVVSELRWTLASEQADAAVATECPAAPEQKSAVIERVLAEWGFEFPER